MICPRCASNQDDQIKFCKSCGANLYAVRQVMDSRETDDSFDWSKTWVAEMFRSSEETKRRRLEMERKVGITPEMKRITEIKAGVIVSSVGVAISLLLFVLMQGVIRGGDVSPTAVEVLSRLWIVGVIPFFVGLALMVNGIVVSKRLVELAKNSGELNNRPSELSAAEGPRALSAADPAEFIPTRVSVTEGTTRHLQNQERK